MEISKNLTLAPKPLPDTSQLGFGKFFSDHWFLSRFTEEKGWFENKIEPVQPFAMHPGASVLHYGQALFEGMKAYRQKDGSISLFRPDFNYERMSQGAARLCLAMPSPEIFKEGLRQLIQTDARWVPQDPTASLYIRPTLIGTEAFLGVRPSREVMFFILLSPVGSYYSGGAEPIKIWVEEKYLRAAPGGLGDTKAGANYAASLKAAMLAREKGYSQVLWLDVEHKGIEEVGTMNVFFVFKNEVITPALNGSILAGGVRDSAITLIKDRGIKMVERKLTIEEVVERQKSGDLLEAFGTGTAAVITPVGALHYQSKDWRINDGKIGDLSSALLKQITGIQRGTEKDKFGWMKPVV